MSAAFDSGRRGTDEEESKGSARKTKGPSDQDPTTIVVVKAKARRARKDRYKEGETSLDVGLPTRIP